MPNSGSIAILASNPTNQLKVALYEACSSQEPIACGEAGIVVENLNVGQTYYIQAWVEADLGGRMQNTLVGNFNIEVVDNTALNATDNILEETLKIFPNPANIEVNIQANSILERIEVFDVSGKKILNASAITIR